MGKSADFDRTDSVGDRLCARRLSGLRARRAETRVDRDSGALGSFRQTSVKAWRLRAANHP
jgi:hypothetical protein